MKEITIKDGESISSILAKKITVFSDTLKTGNIVIICEDAFHSGGTVTQTEPYSRQSVLREEWSPKNNEPFYSILKPKPWIIERDIFFHKNGKDAEHPIMGLYNFAPTRDLAEEIVQIWEGEWLPRKNDYICGYSSRAGISSSWHLCDMEHDFTEEKRGEKTNHYFPSAKQRDAFIEKNKLKEEKPEQKYKYIGSIPSHGFQPAVKLYADENGFLKIK